MARRGCQVDKGSNRTATHVSYRKRWVGEYLGGETYRTCMSPEGGKCLVSGERSSGPRNRNSRGLRR